MEKSLIEVKAESPLTLQDTTAEMLVEQWIKEAQLRSELSEKSYRSGLKIFRRWLEDNGRELTEAALVDYRKFLEENRANSTAKKFFSLALNFVGWLNKRGYLARNIAHGVKGVKLDTDQHSRDAASPAEIAAALATFDTSTVLGKRNAAIFMLACCGLRTVEIVRLDFGDLECRAGQWTLKIWGKGKTSKTQKIVLPDDAKKYIDSYVQARGRAGVGEPLFISTSNENRGQRLQTQSVSRLIKKAFRQSGTDSPRIVAHSLRASNVTIALDNDCDIEDVRQNVRHASAVTTELYRRDQRALRNKTNAVVLGVILKAFDELQKGGIQYGKKQAVDHSA